MLPMRDGVRLYTIAYTNNPAVPAPVVLMRTPYGARNR